MEILIKEQSKHRDKPGCTGLEDQHSGDNCRLGSATAEILSSSVSGAVEGDWGLPFICRLTAELVEEEADKEPSIMAPNHKGTAWLDMGFDCQFSDCAASS